MLIEKAVSYAKSTKKGTTDVRIHFMLDEFPTIGRIPDFKTGLGTWRGYGIDMTIIFQNIPQLMNRYPDNVWNEILAACAIQVCLGAYEDGDITAEHYSKMGGTGTIVLDSERRHFNSLSLLDTKALTQVDKTESLQQAQAVYPNEVKELILDNKMLVTIGASKPFKFEKAGFNETKYYGRIPQKATFENIPLWLTNLKKTTNFRTEYGGVYRLGRMNELPQRIIELIDQWKEEYFNGTGVFISDETMPITYNAMFIVSNKTKQLNRKQGDILIEFLDELINKSNDEFTRINQGKEAPRQNQDKSISQNQAQNNNLFPEIQFIRRDGQDVEETLKNVEREVAQSVTEIVSDEEQNDLQQQVNLKEEVVTKRSFGSNQEGEVEKKNFSGYGTVRTNSNQSEPKILTTGGRKIENRETEPSNDEKRNEDSQRKPSPIKFNVTFNKKN